LREKEIPYSVIYMLEPGRFRLPRDSGELAHVAPAQLCQQFYPDRLPARIFVTHTRPGPMLGILQPLFTGHQYTAALGFVNEGGTLNRQGMLFINHSTWAHILAETARILKLKQEDLLTSTELDALQGKISPEGIVFPESDI
jgi:phosphoketolase